MNRINIRDYVALELTVLSFRPKGKLVREQLKLDEKDKDNEKYVVIFDDHFKSLNSSFWLGLFEDSFRTLSIEAFSEKYEFKCKTAFSEKIKQCLEIIKNKKSQNL